jgi:tryptophan synthase alpha chain
MDGPTIQASSQRALERGTSPPQILELVASVRKRSGIPIVLMTCTNPVFHYGTSPFAQDAAKAGVDGVIVTDLPPEEASQWKADAESANLDTIFLLAPTSTDSRIERVAAMSSGFVYCVSRAGVTGAQADVPEEIADLLRKVRLATGTPTAVGFGISKPEHVRQVCAMADGAVVGSAIVGLAHEKAGTPDLLSSVKSFVSELKAATRG